MSDLQRRLPGCHEKSVFRLLYRVKNIKGYSVCKYYYSVNISLIITSNLTTYYIIY